MYPTGQSTNIGTLLRMIREDQNKSVAATPPAAQPGSPIRELVQEPLSSPEDPGSSRVVSLRPEGVTQAGPDAAPVAPVSPTQAPVAPSAGPRVVAPIAPAPPPTPSPSASSSGGQSNAPAQQRSSAPSTPNIGTSIRSIPQVLGSNTFVPKAGVTYHSNFTPQRSRVGNIISNPNSGNRPTPTPAPQQKSNRNTRPLFGNWLA